jgi:hypothetical protein
MSVILSDWEAEVRKIAAPGQPRVKKVCETPISTEKARHGGGSLISQQRWQKA